MKKICIISNSNLGAFLRYLSIFNNNNLKFLIICSNKKLYNKKKSTLPIIYINNDNNLLFNKKAYEECKKFRPNKIILFYTKK